MKNLSHAVWSRLWRCLDTTIETRLPKYVAAHDPALRQEGFQLPKRFYNALRLWKILLLDHGFFRSTSQRACVDSQGAPVPWYSYPMIEFVRGLDFSARDVFEFGSGHSTLFWAARCRSVRAVEDDPAWSEKVESDIRTAGLSNASLRLVRDPAAYAAEVGREGRRYDVIVVDGRFRYDCAAAALGHLAADGFIILDNAEWFPRTAALLRAAGLLQIPFSGFCPINGYTITTAVFCTRQTVLTPAGADSPPIPVGGMDCRPSFTFEDQPQRAEPVVTPVSG